MPKVPPIIIYPKIYNDKNFAEEFIKSYWPTYRERKHDPEDSGPFSYPNTEFNKQFADLIVKILKIVQKHTEEINHIDALNSMIETMVRDKCPDSLLIITPTSFVPSKPIPYSIEQQFKNALIDFYNHFNPPPSPPKKMRTGLN